MHLPAYEDGTECSETSAYKIRTPGNYPEEIIHHSDNSHVTNKTDASCRAITARRNISQKKSNVKKWMYRYRVIQEKGSVFWEVIVSVISRKTVHMNMCLINGYRDTSFTMYVHTVHIE